ncbi:MAG: hypothetical protein NT007_10260 [Candidatus Kapabacteria bacterium]|nr:hypothetical protein [Candidatus Kapabacteria bacterium]
MTALFLQSDILSDRFQFLPFCILHFAFLHSNDYAFIEGDSCMRRNDRN